MPWIFLTVVAVGVGCILLGRGIIWVDHRHSVQKRGRGAKLLVTGMVLVVVSIAVCVGILPQVLGDEYRPVARHQLIKLWPMTCEPRGEYQLVYVDEGRITVVDVEFNKNLFADVGVHPVFVDEYRNLNGTLFSVDENSSQYRVAETTLIDAGPICSESPSAGSTPT